MATGGTARSASVSGGLATPAGRLSEALRINRLVEEALDVVPGMVAVYDDEGYLVAANAEYRKLHAKALGVLGEGWKYSDLMRATAEQWVAPEQVEEWVRTKIALQQAADSSPMEQLYPGDRWVRVIKRRTASGGIAGIGLDISEIKLREQALAESEERFRTLSEATPVGIWQIDPQGQTLYANPAMCGLLQISGIEQMGEAGAASLLELGAEGGLASLWREPLDRPMNFEGRVRGLAGRVSEVLVIRCRQVDAAGAGPNVLLNILDVTDQKAAESRVLYLAGHDVLTNLPNRAQMRERLDQSLAKQGKPVLVLCLDLDGFKSVNDSLGHAAGDAVLRETAARIRRAVSSGDLVSRVGGDEFVVLRAGGGVGDVEDLCQKLVRAISEPISIDGRSAGIGVSIGASLSPQDGCEPEELLRNADLALYAAKAEGRGTSRIFKPEMADRVRNRRALELDLRRAVAADEFLLHYQPRFLTRNSQAVSVEALIRWRHPERGLVSPGEFIPLAEETGLIIEMGAWVLNEACGAIATVEGLGVSVNLSAVQVRHGDIVETVSRALDRSRLDPTRLELEVTESVLLENTSATLSTLRSLKKLGVTLAMDDFGTGYSCLSTLHAFPFDRIKIDRQFVSSIGAGQEADAIVRSVILLSQALNMGVVAEGVETREQFEFLRREGCREVQGFLFARPAGFEALKPFLQQGKAARSRRCP